MRSFAIAALSAVFLASANALTPLQLAAEIPSCALACDISAIEQVGCGATDFSCHCSHGTQLQAILVPCLQTKSNCTAADLTKLQEIGTEICAIVLNGTNATATASTTAPVATFTGAASYVAAGQGLLALVGAGVVAALAL